MIGERPKGVSTPLIAEVPSSIKEVCDSMLQVNRRAFCLTAAVGAYGLPVLKDQRTMNAATPKLSQVRRADSLGVTDIETHDILLPYHDFNAQTLFRYHGSGIQLRTFTSPRKPRGWKATAKLGAAAGQRIQSPNILLQTRSTGSVT